MAEPLPICHINGALMPLREARISPLDRGFLFADGVYEVIPVYAGRAFRFDEHMDRLARSLASIRMRDPHPRGLWRELIRELIERNGAGDQYVYVQVTRGAEYGRNHAPLPVVAPTIFAFCAPLPQPSQADLENGIRCITTEDNRWGRCDIKAVALLPNVLMRQLAVDAGAQEAILLRNGELMEASASTVHIVHDGVIVTPPNSRQILPGTTRAVVEELADYAGLPRATHRVTEAALRAADEVWLSAATRPVSAVTQLDGRPIGTGKPGPRWRRLCEEFAKLRERLASQPW